jgi:hypothetical protein
VKGTPILVGGNRGPAKGGASSEVWAYQGKGYWYKVDVQNPIESRFYHSGAVLNETLYIYGGVNNQAQVLSDMNSFTLPEDQMTLPQWTPIQ